MRGPSWKATAPASTAPGCIPTTSRRARMPGRCEASQLHQAAPRQHSVGSPKRHHVGDGPQGHDVQVATDVGHRVRFEPARVPQIRAQADDEVEGQPGGAKALVGKLTVRALRIDDGRGCVRQPLRQLVVVDDDHVHTEVSGEGDFVGVGDAAVHRDDELHFAGMGVPRSPGGSCRSLRRCGAGYRTSPRARSPAETIPARRRRWCRPRRSRPRRRSFLHRGARG